MDNFLLFLLAVALVASINGGAVAASSAEEDDLAQRREAMAQVVRLGKPSWRQPPPTDAKTMHRLALFLQREMGPIQTVFLAIRKMPENSASEVRFKEEAFGAAMELLSRHLWLLLPHGSPACATAADAGFGASNMTQNSAATEVLSKEEAFAVAKELMNRLLDQLLADGSVKITDEDQ